MVRIGMISIIVLLMSIVGWARTATAYDLAISQYGQVTATLPWAVAMEKGYLADEGIKIDQFMDTRHLRSSGASRPPDPVAQSVGSSKKSLNAKPPSVGFIPGHPLSLAGSK